MVSIRSALTAVALAAVASLVGAAPVNPPIQGKSAAFAGLAAAASGNSSALNKQSAASCTSFTLRRSVDDVTPAEWEVISQTIRAAATTPDPSGSGFTVWETAAELHNKLAGVVHGNCNFLFWHRMFLSWMERRLQAINPDFFFPYWSSAAVWNNPTSSPIWTYLGRGDGVVSSGALAGITFKSTNSALTRNFKWPNLAASLPSLELYSQIFSESVASRKGFTEYAPKMESLHGAVHVAVGGDKKGQMFTMRSPLDPIFFFHHAFIDYTWFQAQNGWADAGLGIQAQVGYSDQNNNTCTLSHEITSFQGTFADVLDVSSLCVRYLNPGEAPPAPLPVASSSSSSSSTSSTTTTSSLSSTTSLLPLPTTDAAPATTTSATTESVASEVPSSRLNRAGSIVTATTTTASTTTTPPTTTSTTKLYASRADSRSGSVPAMARSTANGAYPSSSSSLPAPSYPAAIPTTASRSSDRVANPVATTTVSGYKAAAANPTASATPQTYGDKQPTLMDKINSNYKPYHRGYPTNYTIITSCPAPLPEMWVARNLRSPGALEAYQSVRSMCDRVLEKVKSGEKIPPPPRYIDDKKRPVLTQSLPAGTQFSPVVVPKINPEYKINGTESISSGLFSNAAASSYRGGVDYGVFVTTVTGIATMVIGSAAVFGF